MIEPYFSTDLGKLYCGDCLSVMPELEPVDLVLTDPPYGLGKRLCGGTWGSKYGGGLKWDTGNGQFLNMVFSISANQIIWGGNYYRLPPSRCWLVWHKPDAVKTMANAELAWTSYDKNSKTIIHSIAATNKERVNHPTQKPLMVIRWCLSQDQNAANILDPFMGSGTTAIACEQLGRRWIGIEISEKYCEIAKQRIIRERQQLKLFKPEIKKPVQESMF